MNDIENKKLTEQEIIRREKIKFLEENNILPFGVSLKFDNNINEVIKEYNNLDKEELQQLNIQVNFAGRLISKRSKGKAGFAHIKLQGKKIQIYIREDNITDLEFNIFKNSDIGDIVNVKGVLFKTKLGELSIRVKEFKHVTKSLRPFPEKFHGLKDVEIRYRKRYLDLITNDNVRETFVLRCNIISTLREYLKKLKFLEVETPILQTIPGGAKARPFKTYHNTLNMDLYMRIAPELYLKRLIIGGLDRVYEIGRNFRNEGIDTQHNPEFTMFEAYLAYANYIDMMDLCENIFSYVIKENNINPKVIFNNKEIDLSKKFKRKHIVDIIKEQTNVDFWKNYTIEDAYDLARKHNVVLENHHYEVGHVINEFFEQLCEKHIIEPTFVYGHPASVSPLTNLSKDKRFTERFELFIGGVEFANAYSELNDPILQLQRFKEQIYESSLGDEENLRVIDYDYIEALEYGMPPVGGIGIGIDRMIMILTGEKSIRDVLLFPHNKNKNEN